MPPAGKTPDRLGNGSTPSAPRTRRPPDQRGNRSRFRHASVGTLAVGEPSPPTPKAPPSAAARPSPPAPRPGASDRAARARIHPSRSAGRRPRPACSPCPVGCRHRFAGFRPGLPRPPAARTRSARRAKTTTVGAPPASCPTATRTPASGARDTRPVRDARPFTRGRRPHDPVRAARGGWVESRPSAHGGTLVRCGRVRSRSVQPPRRAENPPVRAGVTELGAPPFVAGPAQRQCCPSAETAICQRTRHAVDAGLERPRRSGRPELRRRRGVRRLFRPRCARHRAIRRRSGFHRRRSGPAAARYARLDTPNAVFAGGCPRSCVDGSTEERSFLVGMLHSLRHGVFS